MRRNWSTSPSYNVDQAIPCYPWVLCESRPCMGLHPFPLCNYNISYNDDNSLYEIQSHCSMKSAHQEHPSSDHQGSQKKPLQSHPRWRTIRIVSWLLCSCHIPLISFLFFPISCLIFVISLSISCFFFFTFFFLLSYLLSPSLPSLLSFHDLFSPLSERPSIWTIKPNTVKLRLLIPNWDATRLSQWKNQA